MHCVYGLPDQLGLDVTEELAKLLNRLETDGHTVISVTRRDHDKGGFYIVTKKGEPESERVLPTQEEIDKRYDDRLSVDPFGFETSEYTPYMSLTALRAITKDTDDDQLKAMQHELTRDRILTVMSEYMPFAWQKANDFRGLSSSRSIGHYIAWIWLAGDFGFADQIEQTVVSNYQYYGKDILGTICKFYGWDQQQWDDGVRRNHE